MKSEAGKANLYVPKIIYLSYTLFQLRCRWVERYLKFPFITVYINYWRKNERFALMFHRKWNWHADIRPSPPVHPPTLWPFYFSAHTQWRITAVATGCTDLQAVSLTSWGTVWSKATAQAFLWLLSMAKQSILCLYSSCGYFHAGLFYSLCPFGK